jgi:hypothetical protein
LAVFVSLLTSAALCLAGVVSAGPALATPFTRGFTDDVWFDAIGAQWMPKTVVSGAKVALLEIDWSNVQASAPTRGEDPTSPSDPNYNFGYIDDVLRKFAGSGISAAFLVTAAPTWAEQPGGPADEEAAGAYKPNAAALGQFATALAARYSGSYPDPQHPGRVLPRVRYFQAWAEVNFDNHLAPQWTTSGGALVPASPDLYRNMLNAFYAGIKRAHSDNVVVTSGFGPYGDKPGGGRIPPAQFLRALLCLNGRSALTPVACPNPAHFDALAIDPYEVGAPTTKALNPDDVSAADLGKLTRIVNKAVRAGTALPRARKGLWVTEFSYDSNPPNPTAISTATQARWLQESFYIFWSEGVTTDIWYLVRDQVGDFNTAYFSGVYFHNGAPKPSLTAFRFPLVVMPSGRSAVVWGIAPGSGKVSVQLRKGSRWTTLFSVRVGAGSVFTRHVSARLKGSFRAVQGNQTSLTWKR